MRSPPPRSIRNEGAFCYGPEMPQPLTYGSSIHLRSSEESGAFLTVAGALKDKPDFKKLPDSQFVLTHTSGGGRSGTRSQWRVLPAAPGRVTGDVVRAGDKVHLQNVAEGTYLDSCWWIDKFLPPFAQYDLAACGVFTNASPTRDTGTGTWQITKTGATPGEPVSFGDRVTLLNGYSKAGRLFAYGRVATNDAFGDLKQFERFVFTLNETSEDDGCSLWTVVAPAEVYDLAAPGVREQLTAKVQSVRGPAPYLNATPSGGSTNPYTAGFVFIDFDDETGTAGITESFEALTSYETQSKRPTVSDWFSGESNGRCQVNTEVHPSNRDPRTGRDIGYVRVGPKVNANSGDHEALQRAVAAKAGSIPDSWDIVFVCFGKGAKRGGLFHPRQFDGKWGDVTKETVVLDSWVFDEPNDRDWTIVTHEAMHSFGLFDQYGNQRWSSWTLMSCAGNSWHLLSWEKLVLGWLDLEDFVWLKSGNIVADLGEIGSLDRAKGIVYFDDRENAAYVTERAQAIGETAGAYSSWNDHGLIRYRVDLTASWPQITPIVARWDKGTPVANALGAVYRPPANGTVTYPLSAGMSMTLGALVTEREPGHFGTLVTTTLGRPAGWTSPAAATVLLPDDYIESDRGNRARMNPSGCLDLWKDGKVSKIGADVWQLAEYGHFLEVGTDGLIRIVQGTGPTDRREVVWTVRTGAVPKPGPHFLTIVETDNPRKTTFSVFSGTGLDDPARKWVYDL